MNIGTKDFKAVEDLQKKIKKQMNKSGYTKNLPVCTYGRSVDRWCQYREMILDLLRKINNA